MTDRTPIHIMLDLETVSTESNAGILQIGAVTFAPPGIGSITTRQTFDRRISFAILEAHGRHHISKETIQWWDKQDKELREYVFGGVYSPDHAVTDFLDWCEERCNSDWGRIYLWGNSADFDCTILRNFIEMYYEYPINFRNHRCYRTLKSLAHRSVYDHVTPNLQKHNALHDALYQANVATCILNHYPYGWQ